MTVTLHPPTVWQFWVRLYVPGPEVLLVPICKSRVVPYEPPRVIVAVWVPPDFCWLMLTLLSSLLIVSVSVLSLLCCCMA